MKRDLNAERVPVDRGDDLELVDPGRRHEGVRVQAYFRWLEDALVQQIQEADAVFGCVAWLTNRRILSALSGKRWVSLIVQKEDWLRPEFKGDNPRRYLRDAYSSLRGGVSRYDAIPEPLAMMSYCGDPTIEPVRCVGEKNGNRCHHKFAVFARTFPVVGVGHRTQDAFFPYAVWTGSFNWTEAGTRNLENAVLISSEEVAGDYWTEWAQVAALSEPLDWDHEYVAPEWRVGS